MVSGTSPEPISLLLVIPAAGHPCSSAITHLPLATKGKIFFQHQNKKKLSCIDGDFFLIQENMELCLNYIPEMQVKQIHKASPVFVLWDGKGIGAMIGRRKSSLRSCQPVINPLPFKEFLSISAQRKKIG